jgi:rubrerythrin
MKHKKRSAAYPLQQNPNDYCTVGEKIKKKYRTELDAALNAPKPTLTQYVCKFCGFWHNGTSKISGSPLTEQ